MLLYRLSLYMDCISFLSGGISCPLGGVTASQGSGTDALSWSRSFLVQCEGTSSCLGLLFGFVCSSLFVLSFATFWLVLLRLCAGLWFESLFGGHLKVCRNKIGLEVDLHLAGNFRNGTPPAARHEGLLHSRMKANRLGLRHATTRAMCTVTNASTVQTYL